MNSRPGRITRYQIMVLTLYRDTTVSRDKGARTALVRVCYVCLRYCVSRLLKFATCNGRNYETRRAITRSLRNLDGSSTRLIGSNSLDQDHAENVTKGKNMTVESSELSIISRVSFSNSNLFANGVVYF